MIMNNKIVSKEIAAILVSILFLAIGFFAIWLTKSFLKVEGNSVFVSLLFVPIVVYLIISGRIKEIRAPGGLEAKFAEVAEKSIEATAQTIEASVQEMEEVAKRSLQELPVALRNVDESKVNVLTLTIGKPDYYM
jgi:type VI protein secretion system component VasK